MERRHLAECGSTNTEALMHLREGGGPLLVSASRQTAGRGRLGRVVRMAVNRLLPGDALAGVLDDARTGSDGSHRINPPAMYAGITDFDVAARGRTRGFGGHRRCGTVISWVRVCVGVCIGMRARPGL